LWAPEGLVYKYEVSLDWLTFPRDIVYVSWRVLYCVVHQPALPAA